VVAYTPDCREFAGYVLVALRRRAVAARAVVAVHDDGVEARLAAALPDPATLGDRQVVLLAAERSTISPHRGHSATAAPRPPARRHWCRRARWRRRRCGWTACSSPTALVDWSCPDAGVRELLTRLFALPHARDVGELGFGTNSGIPGSVRMNSFGNERVPGIQVGFGQHNQGGFAAPRTTPLHLDLITRAGLVHVDDDPVPLDLAALEPSPEPHPEGPRAFAEDAETDCCGLRRHGRDVPRYVLGGAAPRPGGP
jgi:hypothetical protein